MPRIKLVIEYDGSAYSGWQSQKNQPTIQDALEGAFQTIFRESISVTGSGRTDTGVHARNQVAHADIPESDLFRLKRSLNGLLSDTIVIKGIRECKSDFHARYDAISRRYRYYISRVPTALNRHYAWQVFYPLNLVAMQYAAKRLQSENDFKSFCKAGSEVNHYRCRIFESRWMVENGMLVYQIVANRFLHGMVRAVAGTLVEVGRGNVSFRAFEQMIRARDRTYVPYSAPARGLFLEEVVYNHS